MKKIRIPLSQLEGENNCYFEIQEYPNGDFLVEMRGQDEKREYHTIRAQAPNPINGGGNRKMYEALLKIINTLNS